MGRTAAAVFALTLQRPAVHVYNIGFGDVDQHLTQRLVPVLAAPIERPREVIAGAQWNDTYSGGTRGEAHRIHDR